MASIVLLNDHTFHKNSFRSLWFEKWMQNNWNGSWEYIYDYNEWVIGIGFKNESDAMVFKLRMPFSILYGCTK
jgi:hypothetical protein